MAPKEAEKFLFRPIKTLLTFWQHGFWFWWFLFFFWDSQVVDFPTTQNLDFLASTVAPLVEACCLTAHSCCEAWCWTILSLRTVADLWYFLFSLVLLSFKISKVAMVFDSATPYFSIAILLVAADGAFVNINSVKAHASSIKARKVATHLDVTARYFHTSHLRHNCLRIFKDLGY